MQLPKQPHVQLPLLRLEILGTTQSKCRRLALLQSRTCPQRPTQVQVALEVPVAV